MHKVIGVLKIGENKTDVGLHRMPDLLKDDEYIPHSLIYGNSIFPVDNGVEEGIRTLLIIESLKELYRKVEFLEGGPKYVGLTFEDLGIPNPIGIISGYNAFTIKSVSDFFKVYTLKGCYVDEPNYVRKHLCEFAQREFDIEFIPSDSTFHLGNITGKEGRFMDLVYFRSIYTNDVYK